MPYTQTGAIPPPFAGDGRLGGRLYTEMRSAKYVEGTSGWIIRPDGTAEFYDVTIVGDLQSSNWVATTAANPGTGWKLFENGDAQIDGLVASDITLEAGFIRIDMDGSGLNYRPYQEFTTDLYTPPTGFFYSPGLYAKKEAGVNYVYMDLIGPSHSTISSSWVSLWMDSDYDTGKNTGHFGSRFGGAEITIGAGDDVYLGDIQGTGTIAGTTFANGWVRIGSSSTGIAIDTNEVVGFGGDTFFRSATGDVHLGRGNTNYLTVGITNTTSANHIIPSVDNSKYLGNSANSWLRLYAWAIYAEDGGAVFDLNAGSAETAVFHTLRPDTTNSRNLGSATYFWNQLFVRQIEFANNDSIQFNDTTDQFSFEIDGAIHARITDTGTGLEIKDNSTSLVGDVNVLRADLDNTTATTPVGWHNSWLHGPEGQVWKDDLIPLADSPRFPGLGVLDQIVPYDYNRPTLGWREWGVVLDEIKELDDRLKNLSTKGDSGWGGAVSESGFMALSLLALQDLRKRVSSIEERLTKLEDR